MTTLQEFLENPGRMADRVREVAAEAFPALAGKEPFIVGMALAELTATWVTAHIFEGDPEATEREWKRLLALQDSIQRQLVAIAAAKVDENLGARPAAGQA